MPRRERPFHSLSGADRRDRTGHDIDESNHDRSGRHDQVPRCPWPVHALPAGHGSDRQRRHRRHANPVSQCAGTVHSLPGTGHSRSSTGQIGNPSARKVSPGLE